jgi:hypothetical protein
MNKKNILLLFLSAIIFQCNTLNANTIVYRSPVPDSHYNLPQTNIIIGYSDYLDAMNLNSEFIKIYGSLSGYHTGKIVLAEKNTRLVFLPDSQFETGEKVTVKLKNDKQSFSFFIRNTGFYEQDFYSISDFSKKYIESKGETNLFGSDSMPNITYVLNGPTASGYIFIANFPNSGIGNPTTLMILNNNTTPVFQMDLARRGYDFDKQNDNLLTYYNEVKKKFFGLNRYYQIVDSFWCQGGYIADLHDLKVLSDGSAWLLSYDAQRVDMSVIVPGGNSNALVKGLIVQKIDANKNLVFQWRSWDHFQITDATHENLLDDTIDYVHGNSIEVDTDNNIIISCRHMDEVTKINTANGNIIWRLGGKNNQFTFTNDTAKFSHQHDAERISNGHLTLFDNGNFHTPHYSRAIEFALNETSPKTATIVWQYRRTPSIYSSAMGNVQRLPNGNTLIGWGISFVTLTEVNPAGNILYELYLPVTMSSYRSFRYDWSPLAGINPVNNESPAEYRLYQNYPNPFNPSTSIKYAIPKSDFVTLKIYDMLGKEVKTLINGRLSAGTYDETFTGDIFPSGIYFYRLTAGGFSETKKMILLK